MNQFLASRGFGQSGQTGQAALQTELGRQGALATNAANAGANQLAQNNTTLADAMAFSLANPGSSNTGNATASGNASNWGFGAGAGASSPGFSLASALGSLF
jgi:hypothetical protein